MLGIQLGTVKSRLHYALRSLRVQLEGDRRFGGRVPAAPERRGRGEGVVIELGRTCGAPSDGPHRLRRSRRGRGAGHAAWRSPISTAAIAAPASSSRRSSRSPRFAGWAMTPAASSRRPTPGRGSAPGSIAGGRLRWAIMSPTAGMVMSVALVAVLVAPLRIGGGFLGGRSDGRPRVDASPVSVTERRVEADYISQGSLTARFRPPRRSVRRAETFPRNYPDNYRPDRKEVTPAEPVGRPSEAI